ncbi:hypothetical protein GCM10020331_013670 [Ectobacillus funiculus]
MDCYHVFKLFLGTVVVMMYIALMRMNPGLTLVEWFPAQLGRWIGIPISLLYPLLFLYDAGRIVGDLRDLVPTTLLANTPPLVFNGVFMLVITYALFLGIESLARMGETLFTLILVLFLIEVILLFFGSKSDTSRLSIAYIRGRLESSLEGCIPKWNNTNIWGRQLRSR